MVNITYNIKQIPQKTLFETTENTFNEYNSLKSQHEMHYYTDMATVLNGIVVNPHKEICLRH
jgi:hypothetical protein